MCHFQLEAFIVCPCFDTFFSLCQSNESLSLLQILFLYLTYSISCSYSFSLSLSDIHTCTHIRYSSLFTSALFFLLTYTLTYGPGLPVSSKWQPWATSSCDQIPRNKKLIAQAWDRLSSLDHLLCPGAQSHMWNRPLTLCYRQGRFSKKEQA